MSVYPEGSDVTITFTFADENGDPADPTTAEAQVLAPDGTVTVYELAQFTKASTGVYTLDLVVDQPGRWFYRAIATEPFHAGTGDRLMTVPVSVFDT